MNILISACLLGAACRYDGRSHPLGEVLLTKLAEAHTLIPICPEIYGGLPTPRPPAEITHNRVINAKGDNITEAYRRGAEEALRMARLFGCEAAILKEKSPSCGVGRIYDGSFSRTLTEGNGITADVLIDAGIKVYGESEIEKLI